MNKSLKPTIIRAGEKVHLKDIPSEIETGYDKKSAYQRIAENATVMAGLARTLYAENKRSILLVLQGMDTAGKDGTIRAVMRGMNPRSCQVVSFKRPSEEELDHDFLWRVHRRVPRRGNIGIFNRSHYEDVLIVRVHSLVPPSVWKHRYDSINEFEKLLHENGTRIVKCFLHISKDTQRKRLQARLDDPAKHWKFNLADLAERKLWDDYHDAYESALEKCSTKYAPWYVIPSDKKWCRNLIVSELMRETLENLDPKVPEPDADFDGIVVE